MMDYTFRTISKKVMGDLHTPVSIYLKVRDIYPEWHHFSVDFEYKKTIDLNKLKNGGYSLAIVISSSSDGANFLGAVGSTLWIDSFK